MELHGLLLFSVSNIINLLKKKKMNIRGIQSPFPSSLPLTHWILFSKFPTIARPACTSGKSSANLRKSQAGAPQKRQELRVMFFILNDFFIKQASSLMDGSNLTNINNFMSVCREHAIISYQSLKKKVKVKYPSTYRQTHCIRTHLNDLVPVESAICIVKKYRQ